MSEPMDETTRLENLAYLGTAFRTIEGDIHVLVALPQEARTKTEREHDITIFNNGLDTRMPHLPRTKLLDDVYASIESGELFTLLVSPASSGKTSLLSLLAHRLTEWDCVGVLFFHETDSAAMLLLNAKGIDVASSCAPPRRGRKRIVMVDDAQKTYADQNFWTILIKIVPTWLPNHIRFIISATHDVNGGLESPAEFADLCKFGRDQFLLKAPEEHRFLTQMGTGFDIRFQTPTFLELMIHECGGLIGALRVSVVAVTRHYNKSSPSEAELLQYYLSQDVLNLMARCFGSAHMRPRDPRLIDFLVKCVVAAPHPLRLTGDLEDDAMVTVLKKCGILLEEIRGEVRFSSLLAEKYYSQWLFPRHTASDPTSLRALIRDVIASMSANALRRSVVGSAHRPKEATFQHLFWEGIGSCVRANCAVCLELSRVFSPVSGPSTGRIAGEVDFYLNSTLRWGIELLVNSDGIGEHIARFSDRGKYAPLRVRDYAVVDGCGWAPSTKRMVSTYTVISDDFRVRLVGTRVHS